MNKRVNKREVSRFLDAWFAVRQFIQASNFNRFHQAGLSATQFMTLNLLPSNGDAVTMGELARGMNLKPSTVAQTVDSLEARNLLRRSRAEADKRIVHVCITEAGLELQNAASTQFRTQMARLLARLESERLSGLIDGLESLVQAMALDDPRMAMPAATAPHAVVPEAHNMRESRRR